MKQSTHICVMGIYGLFYYQMKLKFLGSTATEHILNVNMMKSRQSKLSDIWTSPNREIRRVIR